MARDRFAYIDALRGLAAVYVLVYHLALVPNPALLVPYWARPIILNGGTGVTLFFVVSAFTLCHSSQTRSGEASANLKFYIRRVFRIVPLFYVWLALSLIRDWSWYGVTHPLAQVVLNAGFVYNFVPGQETSLVWAGWTLGVEMLFYALFPLILRYVTNGRRALAFLLLTVMLAGAYQYELAYVPMDPSVRASFLQFSFLHILPIFACGILAFYVYDTFIRGRRLDPAWAPVLILGAAAGYGALLSGQLNFLWDSLYWQASLYSALLLGLALTPIRLLVNRALVFFGRISYSVYLGHATVIVGLTPLYRGIYAWSLGASVSFGLCALLTLAVTTPLAYISYRFIEQPGMDLGRRLIQKITARAVEQQPAVG